MENSCNTKNVQMNVQLMFPDHVKEFQCPICAKYFSRKFTLDAHMLIHKGEKPYPCPFCGKSFRQKGTLMRHKALHSSKSLFHCSLCNRGFRQKNVFLHHLKHRHNVSTETLDRRKYRTELKDYQSIMDTLPTFVQANSTAIASSEKHLDAMLLQSVKKHANNSCTVLNDNSFICENAFQSEADFNIPNFGVIMNNGNLSVSNHETYQDDNNGLKFNHCKEMSINQEFIEDVKPILKNSFCEVDTTVTSVGDMCSNMSYVSSPSTVVNGSVYSTTNVSSSNEFTNENLTCVPCQLSFCDKFEFKHHVKTQHVQSVLLGNATTNDLKYSSMLNVTDVGNSFTASDGQVSSVQLKAKKDCVQSLPIPASFNPLNEMSLAVKSEISDLNLDSLKSQTNPKFVSNSSVFSGSELSNYKFKCPVCRIYFRFEKSFKNHSKIHDSCDLLKFMCRSDEDNRNLSVDENFNNVGPTEFAKSSKLNVERANNNESLRVKNNRIVKNIKSMCPKFSLLKRLSCFLCDKTFSNKILFEYHRQLHLSTKGFLCRNCKKNFSSKAMLLSHTRLHHMKTFVCSICSKVFNYKNLFNSHLQLCNSGVNKNTCNGSDLNFPLISIESLLNSNTDGIIGIIPVCGTLLSNKMKDKKVGIPVMSISHIKALYSSSGESNTKFD